MSKCTAATQCAQMLQKCHLPVRSLPSVGKFVKDHPKRVHINSICIRNLTSNDETTQQKFHRRQQLLQAHTCLPRWPKTSGAQYLVLPIFDVMASLDEPWPNAPLLGSTCALKRVNPKSHTFTDQLSLTNRFSDLRSLCTIAGSLL
jgi:hypothetical protein